MLYDSAQKLATLKQFDHDMATFVTKARSAVEELKMFLEASTLKGIIAKLDNMYVVLVLHAMHPDFKHVRDQILTAEEVLSMENLIT